MLPEIPAKRYFTIGEVAELCDVKPHVLRYWEQEFTQLRQIKRRGNRRYYQHHEVLMIRRIRDLLYTQGFTINGARSRLQESAQRERGFVVEREPHPQAVEASDPPPVVAVDERPPTAAAAPLDLAALRCELLRIRELLQGKPMENSPGTAVPPTSDAAGHCPDHD